MDSSEQKTVDLQVQERVAVLTLHRPPLNVLTMAMLHQIDRALEEAAAEPPLAALVVRAQGKHFCAGVDVADHAPAVVGEMIPLFDRVCRRLAEFPAVTLAVVQGSALGGGCEIVACCDFAWMARQGRIGQPEIQLGVFPPVAALVLPRLIGPRWAARLVLTGEVLDGDQAAHIGLVTAAVDGTELDGEVEGFLSRLRDLSAAALSETVRALRIGVGGWGSRLEEIESIYLERLMKTGDAMEGLAAFLEKRPPVWKHV